MAYHGKKLVDLKGDARAARIKQLLSNPGTRKLVPAADLPSSYRQQRQLNTRLNAPIVPGASTTNRDLAHQRNAAVDTQFGPNAVGASQFREKQTNAWFDEYQRQLAQHRANVQGFGEQAQGQVANLGNVQGPAGSAPQDAGNQDVAAKAQAIRSTLLGAQKGQLLGQGQAANTYADTLAHVVAPGQKVQALTQAAGATDALRQKIGAFKTQFEGTAKTDEAKNVLAQQALTGKTAAQQAQDAIDEARIGETTRHNKASESNTAASRRATAQSKATAGDHYGYTNAQWATMDPAARRAAAKKWKATTGVPTKAGDPATQDAKNFYAKYGVKPAATAAVGNAKSAISSASTWVNTVLKSNPKMGPNALGQLLVQGQAGSSKKGEESLAVPKQQALWVRVALDQRFNHGKITAATADRLHKAGYSVKTLGLATVPGTGSSTYVNPRKSATTGSRQDSSR